MTIISFGGVGTGSGGLGASEVINFVTFLGFVFGVGLGVVIVVLVEVK